MSEFFPTQMRASSISFGSAVGSLSIAYMPIVGLLINRYHLEVPITKTYIITGWRLHMLINLIPGMISLLLMRKLPESPKYLVSANRNEECLQVLRDMYEKNTGKSRFSFPVQQLKASDDHEDHSMTRTSNKSM